jgi:hypothetical protein
MRFYVFTSGSPGYISAEVAVRELGVGDPDEPRAWAADPVASTQAISRPPPAYCRESRWPCGVMRCGVGSTIIVAHQAAVPPPRVAGCSRL